MNIFENIKMALDSIRSNKMRSFLTMLGIIIGISSVIAIVSLGQGGQRSITGEFEKIGASTVNITARSSEAIDSDYITEEDIKQIKEKVEYVKYVTPAISAQGVAKTDKKSISAIFTGSNEGYFYINNFKLLAGRFFNEMESQEGRAVAVIMDRDAKRFFGTTDVVGKTINIGMNESTKKVTIIGVIKGAFEMFDNFISEDNPIFVYLPASFLSMLFSVDFTYDEIIIMADKKENTEAAGIIAKNIIENRHGNRERNIYKINNMMKQLDQINNVLGIFTTFITAVAAISLLVGGVGVMNIMLVSVTERTREIGIRKAIGAKTGHIMVQFLTESVIISCIGGLIGLILGIAGAYGLGQFAKITPSVSPQTIFTAIAFSSAVGVFFGIYPARKAAKLDPIDALRYE